MTINEVAKWQEVNVSMYDCLDMKFLSKRVDLLFLTQLRQIPEKVLFIFTQYNMATTVDTL